MMSLQQAHRQHRNHAQMANFSAMMEAALMM